MSILGIGTDIVENLRIRKLLKNKKFINRIFTKNEIENSKKITNKINYFSKKFSAKEAFVKALGTGIIKGINLLRLGNNPVKIGENEIYKIISN